jgi:hypothetical protein
MLLSYTAGGDIYSQTIAAIQGRGLTADTEDRLNIYFTVTATGEPNINQINNSSYYFNNLGFGPSLNGGCDGRKFCRLQPK